MRCRSSKRGKERIKKTHLSSGSRIMESPKKRILKTLSFFAVLVIDPNSSGSWRGFVTGGTYGQTSGTATKISTITREQIAMNRKILLFSDKCLR